MYQIYIRSNEYLQDDSPLYQIAELPTGKEISDQEFLDENIVEMKKYPEGSGEALKIKMKEMTVNEALDFLADLLDCWGRISIEWSEIQNE
ncbi:hypothetical protein N9E35_01460 [Candidatus Marinimicrobia bacterium]|nr:hypothetical protein [Candidatus Neomarinimicrobiota bacterium]